MTTLHCGQRPCQAFFFFFFQIFCPTSGDLLTPRKRRGHSLSEAWVYFHQFTFIFTLHCTVISGLAHTQPLARWLPCFVFELCALAFIAEVSCLLARLASFRPARSISFRLGRRSRLLARTPTRRGVPVSLLRCRARFFLSLMPALVCLRLWTLYCRFS